MAALTPASRICSLSLYDIVRQLLGSHPAWRVRDPEGYWVCPYCADPTPIKLEHGRLGPAIVRKIASYVGDCDAFDERAPLRIRPVHEVKRGAVRKQLLGQLVPKVRHLTRHVEVWRVIDPDKHWRCPYCAESVACVNCGPDGPDPVAVAGHLLDGCAAYRAKQKPSKTAMELWERAGLADPERVARMKHTEKRLRTRRRELAKAAQSQRSMLPPLPSREGFNFASHYEPGGFLAGGFYDFHDLPGGKLGLVVGEVRGDGLDAALAVGMCKKVLSISARQKGSPIETLIASNEEIFNDLGDSTQLALIYGVLDPIHKKLTFVRAGHEPPLFYRPGLAAATVADQSTIGVALGSVRGSLFKDALSETTVTLEPGDMVLLFTSGLVEARCKNGQRFGRRNLRAALLELGNFGPKPLVSAISTRLEEHLGGAPRPDQLLLSFWVDPMFNDATLAAVPTLKLPAKHLLSD